VTISGLSSGDVGKSMVIFTPDTQNEFQTTISGVSGSTVTLGNNADVTATGRTAYYGSDSTSAVNSAASAAASNGECLYIQMAVVEARAILKRFETF
jgi:hypothetical protein